MNLRHVRDRLAVPASLAVLCASCGASPPREQPAPANPVAENNYFVGEQAIYAHLVAVGGGWIFSKVTDSDAPADGAFVVRLNDLTPAFDTRVAECAPQVYPEFHRCNPLHPFREKRTGVLDKLINSGIAVGTAGKVTDIAQTYETHFDEPAFNQAVDEALINTGLDASRHRLIAALDNHAALRTEARLNLSLLREQQAANRTDTDSVPFEIRPEVSGLTEYYEGDIDYRQLIELSLQGDAASIEADLEHRPVLPCETRQCLPSAEQAVAALQHDLARLEHEFAEEVSPEVRVYGVSCQSTVQGSYAFEASCPQQLTVTAEQPAVLPVTVNILSRDFVGLYPDLHLTDENLAVSIDGDTIVFENATLDYVTLTAQTVYYNSRTNTSSLALEIPPGSSVTRPVKEFVSSQIEVESSYRQMTPEKAANASFRFGLAVRYRIASVADEATLHTLETYNVGCVIENRIRPGSCRPPTVAGAAEPFPQEPPGFSRPENP